MSDERKTLDQRAQMTDLERLRHSASHVLATAILKIWPEAQFAAGPPVENGFYYDVDLPHRISPDDFEKIEAEMKSEIKANHPFERIEVSRDEALALGKKGRLAALGERGEPSRSRSACRWLARRRSRRTNRTYSRSATASYRRRAATSSESSRSRAGPRVPAGGRGAGAR